MSRRKARANRDRHEDRRVRGEQSLASEKNFEGDWNLRWFTPEGGQTDIVDSLYKNVFTLVTAPAGCGKSAVAFWLALNALKCRETKQVVYIKTPVESAVAGDQIGFLKGGLSEKLEAFMQPAVTLLEEFVPKTKLEADMASKKVWLTIPNYAQGISFNDCTVIIDEAQNITPNIVKLLLERCGRNTRYLVLGDHKQCYAAKSRENGFQDLVDRVTYSNYSVSLVKPQFENIFGYVKLNHSDNHRSEASRFITELYEGE